MCQHPNAVMHRFMMLIRGEAFTEQDRLLFKDKASRLSEEAERRGQYELAVMLELCDEQVSNAQYTAERYENALTIEAKLRLFHAFREHSDDVARLFQHHWKLSKHLPKEFRR